MLRSAPKDRLTLVFAILETFSFIQLFAPTTFKGVKRQLLVLRAVLEKFYKS